MYVSGDIYRDNYLGYVALNTANYNAQVQVQFLYFPKEYKWSYTFQKHIEYIQVSMGRKAEKAMLISLLTSGELKKYTQKNARYMKHKKLENIFTQTLLRTHSLYANMNTYSMYHNHIF